MSDLHFTLLWRQSDWGFYGRRNEVFARELAARSDVGRVVHVEPVSVPELGRYARRWMNADRPALKQAYATQLAKALPVSPLVRADDALYVASVVVLAKRDHHASLRRINEWLVRLQMRRIRQAWEGVRGVHCTVAYLPSPYATAALDVVPSDIVVADLIDDVPAQVDDPRRRRVLEQSYADVLPRCAWAFATSPHVARTFQPYAEAEIDVIRNGVHVDAAAGEPARTERTVGYVGMMNRTMNVELVEAVTAQLPTVSFKFVGPVHPDLEDRLQTLRERDNVEFLGPMLKSEVHAFLRTCTVLMSFKHNDAVTAGNDSMKIYEYLASGRPVVSTSVAPADRFDDVVLTADTPAEFVVALRRALDDDDPARRDVRLDVARANAWDDRIETFVRRVRACLP